LKEYWIVKPSFESFVRTPGAKGAIVYARKDAHRFASREEALNEIALLRTLKWEETKLIHVNVKPRQCSMCDRWKRDSQYFADANESLAAELLEARKERDEWKPRKGAAELKALAEAAVAYSKFVEFSSAPCKALHDSPLLVAARVYAEAVR